MSSDLISREAALQEVLFRCNQEITKYRTMHRALGNVGRAAFDGVKATPAVDAAPVVHGHWIYHVDDLFPTDSTQECSVCHEEEYMTLRHENYCPNCGAIMRGDPHAE